MYRMMNKKRKTGVPFMVGGLLLIAAALFLTGYNLWDEKRAADSAEDILEQIVPVLQETPDYLDTESDTALQDLTVPDYVLNPKMDMPVISVDGHEYIGVLTIPALNLSLPVMSDWSDPTLKITPNRYHGSAYADNLIIAGHNYSTHFGELKTLSSGDQVTFTDVNGNQFSYAVLEIELLMSTDVERMETGDWDLTLFTCTLGGKKRVTIRCEKLDSPE